MSYTPVNLCDRRPGSTSVAVGLGRKDSAPWILEGDIAACFDELSHDWLLAHIPIEKAMLQQWLKAGFMERSVWHTTEAGSPQGSPISPVIANLALDGRSCTSSLRVIRSPANPVQSPFHHLCEGTLLW